MEDVLYYKDLFQPLENEGAKPDSKSDVEWNVTNKKYKKNSKIGRSKCLSLRIARDSSINVMEEV